MLGRTGRAPSRRASSSTSRFSTTEARSAAMFRSSPWVLGEVVELGADRPQVLVAVRADPDDRAPTPVEVGGQGLDVGDERVVSLPP